MEHIYIRDAETNRSLWITTDEGYSTILTDGMPYRETIKPTRIRKVIKDWMRGVTKLYDKVEGIEFMELYQYTGEPTESEIQQRLEFWNSWSPNSYKDNHLRIHHRCPMCESDEDTDWVRGEWNVCYHCFIAFTLEDIEPVYDPTHIEYEEVWYG